jgi:hypothetical protein
MVENSAELETKIKDAPNNEVNIMQLLTRSRTGGSTISHRIFQIFPANEDRLLASCRFEIVSRWALNLLLHKYEVHTMTVAADFYLGISTMPEAASLRGHIFERQVLNYLSDIGGRHEFPLRRLSDSIGITWVYSGRVRRFMFHESTIRSEITKAVENKEQLLMIPLARNFPAVDAILYDPKDESSLLTCIQITRNKDHDIFVPGLRCIQSWLKRKTVLEPLRPSTKTPWRFVFVVPFGMMDTFKSQDLVANKTNNVGDWPKKVHQYVLGLKDESIF